MAGVMTQPPWINPVGKESRPMKIFVFVRDFNRPTPGFPCIPRQGKKSASLMARKKTSRGSRVTLQRRCGEGGARRDSDATTMATTRSLLRQPSPPVVTFSPGD
uniref:Uncharacterized protein n=1 Tax=Oryza punctata TaxID=4537 RepID=A0A0E0KF15_ORYPU